MINIETERLLPLAEAGGLPVFMVGRGGRRLAYPTLWRWARRGIKGVRLETVRSGGRTLTSLEAVARFCAALDGHVDAEAVATTRTPARRQREIAVAERECALAGL